MNYSNMVAFRMSYVVTTPALSELGYWSSSFRIGRRHLGAHSNRYSSNFLSLEQGWRTFLRANSQIADHFWRKSLAYGSLSLPAYLIFFLWCFSAPYTLARFGFDEVGDMREYYTFIAVSCSWQKQLVVIDDRRRIIEYVSFFIVAWITLFSFFLLLSRIQNVRHFLGDSASVLYSGLHWEHCFGILTCLHSVQAF